MSTGGARVWAVAAWTVVAAWPAWAPADEGMWLFNNVPAKVLKERHGFSADAAWLEHVQRSAVRIGASGSFVSADGLVMTNHHVGFDAIQKLSRADRDLLRNGFLARTREQELRCYDMELNVLMEIEDVTARVNAAVKPDMTSAQAFEARRAAMNTLEKESLDRTGLRSDVVTLYHGGLYHLYRYKKYTDVRLVFAPEFDAAFFGGDCDNFEYPRYCLDVSFFRAYEDGKPARVQHYLKWNTTGLAEGELVFVCGHPGRTERLQTVAHLAHLRDNVFPWALDRLRRTEVTLRAYAERSKENARRAAQDLFGVQNGRKARLGGLAGLQGPAVLARKRADEAALREAVAREPALRAEAGSAWDEVAAAVRLAAAIHRELELLEHDAAFRSRLFGLARTLVRLADEKIKPNDQRLREFRESNLDSLKLGLFSEAPIYKDLETLKLGDSLGLLVEQMGAGHDLVRQVLAGRSPQERAAELVAGTGLQDAAARRALAEGGQEAVRQSKDPMIALARLVDPAARAVRKKSEEGVDEPLRQAYAKIARAQFAIHGTNLYPDATGTLRLAFGQVKGYSERGRTLPPWTTLGGTFERAAEHDSRPPFRPPTGWTQVRDRLALETPFNFVCTADIIGGNSGSPVVNRKGELVGLIFDGNIQSLVWPFLHDQEQGRAVAVHAAGMLEALQKIYKADELAAELTR